jgi:hypothetical protein
VATTTTAVAAWAMVFLVKCNVKFRPGFRRLDATMYFANEIHLM